MYTHTHTHTHTYAWADKIKYIKVIGIKSFRFDFREETYNEVTNVLNIYVGKMEYDKANYTKGQFRRGIE